MSPPTSSPPRTWPVLSALGEAVRFLTILPVPGRAATDERVIARSMAAFPLVGLLVGGLSAGGGRLAHELFGAPLHAIVCVVAAVGLTAGLHLDGVADTCDAVFSWRSRERKLEIMRDSRIGTMGALGLIVILLLKVGALVSLGEAWWVGAILAPLWGRWADTYGLFWFAAAREGGMGRTFQEHVRRRDFVLATALALLLGGAVNFPAGVLVIGVLAPLIHLTGRWLSRSLGGLTGDTYGFLCELAEAATLLSLVAWQRHPGLAAAVAAALPW